MIAFFHQSGRSALVLLCLLGLIGLGGLMCDGSREDAATASLVHPNGKRFAGSAACQRCHAAEFLSHRQTAHYRTSLPADPAFIKGSLDSGKNFFTYGPGMQVAIEKRPEGLFQAAYIDGVEKLREPMDIIIGSGRKGQTFLYWSEEHLFQLPISYYAPLDSWCNSPGYPRGQILFNRPIPNQCLECHSTFFKALPGDGAAAAYDKRQVIYGVDCERCHGPGADHVTFQSQHPEARQAKFIINPARLSREQRLDGCALCHSGIRKERRSSFAFTPGDKLSDYSDPGYKVDSAAFLDVHANQYGLLTASKCFRSSQTLDCTSCHDPHVQQRDPASYSRRCLSCHQTVAHDSMKLPAAKELASHGGCIDCHMPLLPTNKIALSLSDPSRSAPDLVRSHLIAIYAKKTRK